MLNPIREVLANGLTLLALPLPHSAVVTADIWVRSGARTEPTAYQGISHFLEHLVFKGTEQLPPGTFDYAIEERGGATNAATSFDFTHYYITVAKDDLGDCLPLLADLVCQAAIPEAEFDPERLVVLEEIRRAQDNPDRQIYQILATTLYQNHPYARPVLGEPENLLALTADIVRQFHRERYRPEALTVVLAGGLPAEALLAAGRTNFAAFHNPTVVTPTPPEPEMPAPTGGKFVHQVARLQQPRLLLAWMGPGISELTDGVALEFLSAILTTGRTSRLVRQLREEKGWARNINSYFSLQHDPGLFVISAQVESVHLEETEALIRHEIAQLQNTLISEAELEKARRLLVSEFVFGTETPSQTSMLYGYYSTVAHLDLVPQYRRLLDTLDSSQLQASAQRYLSTPTTLTFLPHAAS